MYSPSSMARYFPGPHIRWCATPDGLVLLDLRRGRYFGLGSRDASALSGLVTDWTPANDSTHGAPAAHSAPDSKLVEALCLAGVLVQQDSRASDAAPEFPEAAATLDPWQVEATPHASARHLLRLLWSRARVGALLRTRTLETIVRGIQTRKTNRTAAARDADRTRVIELAAIFMRQRAFFFTAKERCLVDSLTLVEFLAQFRVFPLWVIGVRTQPFAAHSWVQHGTLVLNDTPERVRAYSPILVV